VISRRQIVHPLADLDDDARALVTTEYGKRGAGMSPVTM